MDTLHHQLTALDKKFVTDTSGRGLIQALAIVTARLRDSLPESGLASLTTAIMSADRQPTAQMFEALASLRETLTGVAKGWEHVVAGDLSNLNSLLTRHGLSGIAVPPSHAASLRVTRTSP